MNTTDKRLDARKALLEAARGLFIEKGYEAVSTRELAETAGVNLGAIQYHFGSKAKLFVEAVRTSMTEASCSASRQVLQSPVTSRAQAAERVIEYVLMFLDDLLHPKGPQPCKVFLREIFTPTRNDEEMFEALTTFVVDDFARPNSEMLAKVLQQLCPELPEERLTFAVQSIVGQCFFYLTHQPFIQRLRGTDCAASPFFEQTVAHVAAFSMRALGCEADLIKESLMRVFDRHGLRRVEIY